MSITPTSSPLSPNSPTLAPSAPTSAPLARPHRHRPVREPDCGSTDYIIITWAGIVTIYCLSILIRFIYQVICNNQSKEVKKLSKAMKIIPIMVFIFRLSTIVQGSLVFTKCGQRTIFIFAWTLWILSVCSMTLAIILYFSETSLSLEFFGGSSVVYAILSVSTLGLFIYCLHRVML